MNIFIDSIFPMDIIYIHLLLEWEQYEVRMRTDSNVDGTDFHIK